MNSRQIFTSFFSTLVTVDAPIHFRLLDPKKVLPPEKVSYSMDDIYSDESFSYLTERNRQGYGIYFVVNDGGHTARDINRIRAHFIDCDGGLSYQVFLDSSKALPPRLVVNTSEGRFHAYWTIEDGDVSEFSAIQRQLAECFKSDETVIDPSRLMRVPGFLNTKQGNYAVHLQEVKDRYDPIPLAKLKAAYCNGATKPKTNNMAKVRAEGFKEGERNKGLFTYAVRLYAKALDDAEVMRLCLITNLKKCVPPLNEKEVSACVLSAQKTAIAQRAIDDFADAPLPPEPIADEHIPEDTVQDIKIIISEKADFPETSLPPTSLVTRVYHYLISTAFETTHELALAGALAFVGALKGHTCRTTTNARTNLFLLALAPSGTGKTEIKNRLFALSHAAGLKNFNIANPASEAGMLDALTISRRRFVAWDEFGLRLSSLTRNKNATSYEQGIVPFLLDVFSAAGSIFYDKTRRIDPSKKKTEEKTEAEIAYPHLSIYAISTPETFYKSVSLAQVEDGFIPRFIPVFSPALVPQRITSQDRDKGDISDWLSLSTECHNLFSTADFIDEEPPTKRFTPEAFNLWADFQFGCRQRDGTFTPIWLRAAEHAMKVALTICDDDEISSAHIAWSIDFISSTLEYFIGRVTSRTSATEMEALYMRILSFIGKYDDEGCLRRDLCARFSRTRDFKACLQATIDSGAIEIFDSTSEVRSKTQQKYRLSPLGRKKALEHKDREAQGLSYSSLPF